MSKRTLRRGFSVVELVVVIAVVAVAVALTIPAVQRARESARQLQCKNNLKQIGLALHNYHESFGRLPSGFIGVNTQGMPEVSGPTGWGWAAMILPQLDENELFARVNFNASILDSTNADVYRTQLPEFRCPSDSGDAEFTLLAADGQTPLAKLPTANYVGNFGSGDLDYCQNLVGMGMPCTSGPTLKSDGVFFHNSSVKLESITDGMASTLMVAERSTATTSSAQRTATWLGVIPGSESAYSLNLGSMSVYPSQVLKNDDGFSSVHVGGVEMLMADAQVKSFSNDTDPGVLLSMATRNGSSTDNPVSFRTGWATSVAPTAEAEQASDDDAADDEEKTDEVKSSHRQSKNLRTTPRNRPTITGARVGATGEPLTKVNLPGYVEFDGHFTEPLGDFTYAGWGGSNPNRAGTVIIKYDFRELNGFANIINEEQKALSVKAMQAWSDALCGKIVFVQDTTASDDEIIIIGVGSLLTEGIFDGPGGIVGFSNTVLVGDQLTQGFAWMDEEETWDNTLGPYNDPPNFLDFFTVVAHEIGHALGLGHNDDLFPGHNMMDADDPYEESEVNFFDISALELIYGTNCIDGPGLGGVRRGWLHSDQSPNP